MSLESFGLVGHASPLSFVTLRMADTFMLGIMAPLFRVLQNVRK
jgi:hypothetical protein